MPTLPAEDLGRIALKILEALGTPEDLAQVVRDSLVEANLQGHDSHGVLQLPLYVRYVRTGQVRPEARPSVQTRQHATAHVDGAWGWGQVAARLAAQTVIELAERFGVGATTIGRCNHVGRLGEYAAILSRAGMVGLVLCNTDAVVVPHGGREPAIGTNPLAWAVPRGPGHDPLLLDFATASVAEGKLRVAQARGERVPPGLLLDRCGRPSQDPADFFSGGALLPFGGHKGSALSTMIELTAGVLSGMAPSALPEYGGGNGTLLLGLNIASFVPLERFFVQALALSAKIKSTPAATGFHEVMLPGEPEVEMRRQRLLHGIPFPDQTWKELQDLATDLQSSL
jgi:LDH2 family malate/lactate/ureidoglycolate dehydrogenase